MHTHIHAHIHAHIHTYMHAYTHTSNYTRTHNTRTIERFFGPFKLSDPGRFISPRGAFHESTPWVTDQIHLSKAILKTTYHSVSNSPRGRIVKHGNAHFTKTQLLTTIRDCHTLRHFKLNCHTLCHFKLNITRSITFNPIVTPSVTFRCCLNRQRYCQ